MNSRIILSLFIFLSVFHELLKFSELIHGANVLLSMINVDVDVIPKPFFEYIIHIIFITLMFYACLLINKWYEIRKLTLGGSLAKIIEKRKKELDSFNWHSLISFSIFATFLIIISKIDTIRHSEETLIDWLSATNTDSINLVYSAVFSAVAWLSIFVARNYWFSLLRDIQFSAKDHNLGMLLSDFDEKNLNFRHVNENERIAKLEITKLADTEDYGPMGNTDIEQVFEWWQKYNNGNWLAEYCGDIVGGIDMWPITDKVYNDLVSGEIGEEEINKDSLESNENKLSYWYIASISLDMRMQNKRYRKALLIKMLSSMIRENFLPAIVTTEYPIKLIALTWTVKGENFVRRAGFKFVGKRKSQGRIADENIYQIVFSSREDIINYVTQIEQRLGFRLRDIKGNIHRLTDYKGKWVLIYFWSINDQYSLKGIQELMSLYRESNDLQILSVAIEFSDIKTVKEFARENEIQYPIILGNSSVLTQFDKLARKPNTYYLFDPVGRKFVQKNGLFLRSEINNYLNQ